MQHILLLHGAIGAKDQLDPLAERLSSACTVHTLNFTGHGGEPFNGENFSIPLFAAEVLDYLREKKISSINIFGYSMGGYVAMFLAKYHPAVVGRIITLATKFHWDGSIAAREVKMLDADTIVQKLPVFAEQLAKRHHPNDWKLVLEKTKDMLTGLGIHNTLQPEDYKAITAPCLLLLGDKDKMITLEETLTVQDNLPNGIYCSLPGTPHPIEQVNPEMLASFITEFVSG
ncbi:MAG TPA: alpha/beta fold hydrolase [Chitinophagaceae bacterium]|nr:alpha/beta fold hydrolase [Chitinophagaceae bacterium]